MILPLYKYQTAWYDIWHPGGSGRWAWWMENCQRQSSPMEQYSSSNHGSALENSQFKPPSLHTFPSHSPLKKKDKQNQPTKKTHKTTQPSGKNNNPQTASAWSLLSEPKQICFHKRIMSVSSLGFCIISHFGNTLLPGTMHHWGAQTLILGVFNNCLPRRPNGPNILPETQNYPDQNCSAVTSWKVLKNLAGWGKAHEISLGNWASIAKGCRNFSVSSRWRFKLSWGTRKSASPLIPWCETAS